MFLYNTEQWSKIQAKGKQHFLLVDCMIWKAIPVALIVSFIQFLFGDLGSSGKVIGEHIVFNVVYGMVFMCLAGQILWVRKNRQSAIIKADSSRQSG
jgi:hypothetical protein